DGGLSVTLTGGNNGSGLTGFTDLSATATQAGLIAFQYMYASLDLPGFDWAGYFVGALFTQLADTDGDSGTASFPVALGDTFGFRVVTFDNTQEPGVFTVSDFSSDVPEPCSLPLVAAALAATISIGRRRSTQSSREN
ncbi:MAG: hypothetical protein JWP63_5498, partial [Candidatus Solibacter sp.]|nr:hypothetical protein [Candidatus Solibacter sp.]